jgi:hypothetical protein
MRTGFLFSALTMVFGLLNTAATQQQQQAPAMAATQSPAQAMGLITYPSQGQTKDQQLLDEQQCYGWAKENTGIDPAAVRANPDSAAKAGAAKVDSAAAGAAVRGAARGAAGGAIIGGITGDAGEGAAVGAVVGAVGGRRAKKSAEAQVAAQSAQANQQQVAQILDTFKRAMKVCLEGRGYTVQ